MYLVSRQRRALAVAVAAQQCVQPTLLAAAIQVVSLLSTWGVVGGVRHIFARQLSQMNREDTKAQRTTRLNVSTWTLACFVFATDFHGNIRKHR